ncbi:MAG: hypothetical protein V1903_04135 [Bacteroidota bacterium]
MSLIKDITKVSAANLISLFAVIITGFIVPAFLSIEQYAYLKTFALLFSFVGVLHLGYTDGIYIKYGGKYEEEIDKKMFTTEKLLFIFFQSFVAVMILVAGIILREPSAIAVAAAILPYNMLSYYQFFYQAVGQFNIYSGIRLTIPFIILAFNILLIYVFRVSDYLYYIAGEILAYTIVVLYLEFRHSPKRARINFEGCKAMLSDNIKVGFFIMIGNLAMILFSTIGRWAVKLFLDDASFAYFSFASSMMQVLTILISAVAMTFYPYLSRLNEEKNNSQLKIRLLLMGALLSSSYFVFNFAVRLLIPKYNASLNILGIMFASFPAYAVINALYINLYKVSKDGKKYIRVILFNLVVAAFFTTASLLIGGSIVSVSIAITLSYYFWMYYSSKDFMGLRPSLREIIFVILYLMIFFSSMLIHNAILGIFIFLSLLLVLSLLYKEDIVELFMKFRSLTIR